MIENLKFQAHKPVPALSGRRFLQGASSLASAFPLKILQEQTFRVGIIISVGKTSVANGRAEVWEHCDEVAQLGFHRFEVNNRRAAIAESYAERTAEYKKQLGIRHLDLVGWRSIAGPESGTIFAALLEQHRVIWRFLAAVGGKYITHMLAPGEILNESDKPVYRDLDVKVRAKNCE